MYRLKLNEQEYSDFKRKVKAEMILRDIKVEEIAEQTNYTVTTIRHFLSNQNSKFVARAIADVLGIEVNDERVW